MGTQMDLLPSNRPPSLAPPLSFLPPIFFPPHNFLFPFLFFSFIFSSLFRIIFHIYLLLLISSSLFLQTTLDKEKSTGELELKLASNRTTTAVVRNLCDSIFSGLVKAVGLWKLHRDSGSQLGIFQAPRLLSLRSKFN